MVVLPKLRLIGLVVGALLVALTGTAQGPPPQFVTLTGIDVSELERCDNLKLLVPDGVAQGSAEHDRRTF